MRDKTVGIEQLVLLKGEHALQRLEEISKKRPKTALTLLGALVASLTPTAASAAEKLGEPALNQAIEQIKTVVASTSLTTEQIFAKVAELTLQAHNAAAQAATREGFYFLIDQRVAPK